MNKRLTPTAFLLCTVFSSFSPILAQEDPVLFQVDGTEVPVSEFEYIYQKNNRDEADYSQSSISEYLDLYIKFKLKVQKAKELQLDTIQALKDELAGYRNQLAKSYLNDREVKSRLVSEIYERMQWDLHLGHILIKADRQTRGQELQSTESRVNSIYKRLEEGEPFEELAKKLSEDKNTRDQGGDLGYLTAKFPNGFYAMETAAYSLLPGKISKPVRSALGFHILKLYDRRPARGEMDASHILVRVSEDGTGATAAEQKIRSIHSRLKTGEDFESLARKLSEDAESAPKGGYIGSFGINVYEQDFEDAAFKLTEDNAYTEPVRSSLGWHIIKRIRIKEIPPFEDVERRLEAQITRDERIGIARESMVDIIIKEAGLQVDTNLLENLAVTLDKTFYTYQWTPPEMREATLLSFRDGNSSSNLDFLRWLRLNARSRLRLDKEMGLKQGLLTLFDEYVENRCLSWEESNLERKYPEFKALMREYEEGILLFEVTKMAVWDKAAQDTAGLKIYFEQNRDKYMWPERLLISAYTLDSADHKKLEKILKWESKLSPEKLLAKVNKKGEVLHLTKKKIEPKEAGDIPWQARYRSKPEKDSSGNFEFIRVEEILPPEHKNLNEARGYIIADYQDQLEREWIAELKSQYEVEVNQKVLEGLIKT